MSTIDMNSVAGFKAVDAEGNELGIMSMADITAAVKESIMQDAAMARSVATLSEASTLAASDTYEDKLPQQTDLTWARGLDANGNPILISKQSLASVVGELARKLIFGMFGGKYNIDANDLIDTGCYYLITNITNAVEYSYLVSFKPEKNTCFQINVQNQANWIKFRTLQDTGKWSDWKNLQIS